MEDQRATYTAKIGLPPGSLVYIGDKKTQEVTISEINYSVNSFEEKKLKTFSDCTSWTKPEFTTMVSVIGIHDTTVIEAAGAYFDLDAMTLEDIVDTNSRSKLEEFDTYLFLPMKILGVDAISNEILSEHVSLILTKNGLVTFQEGEIKILSPFRERLRLGKGKIRQRKSDYIFYRLIDTFVDNYFIVSEYLSDRLDTLEEKILQHPSENVNQEIYELKKKISYVKRSINPLRECISNIIKSDSDLVSESTQNYFRDVYDHLLHLGENIDSQRETVNDFLNLYMSAMSNKMNEVMKVLTIFASIFIPLTFIAGIYGMNFELIPELKWKYGYFIIWGVMIAVVVALLFFFKRKKWL